MSAFKKVSGLFQSIDRSIAAANRLFKAYADGVGHPEYYFELSPEKAQDVAMNLAGLDAADTAANILASQRDGLVDGNVTEAAYTAALKDIADAKLSGPEVYVVNNVANATWRAGQGFRDITTKPLQRLTREINAQFNLLVPDERAKDLIQVQEGARILLEAIAA